jgi:hypothetical protein
MYNLSDVKNALKSIKVKYESEHINPDIQVFDTCFTGDEKIELYNKDDVSILYCPSNDYLEILGLTRKDYLSLVKPDKCLRLRGSYVLA